jgi:hypothetical protein
VVVCSGTTARDLNGTDTPLFKTLLKFGDRQVTPAAAQSGVQLGASLIPTTAGTTFAYSLAYGEDGTNTAGAAVSAAGVLTANQAGTVRVNVLATAPTGKTYTRTATIWIGADSAGLTQAITGAAGLKPADYTPASWAAYQAALKAAQAVDPATASQAEINAAKAALDAARDGLVKVAPAAAPRIQGATPKITGTARVSKTLKVKKGTWTPGAAFTYRWYQGGKQIKAATKATLKLKAAQKGKRIRVKVTGHKAGYTNLTKVSKATAKVKAKQK